jgi:hypothetical protein
MCSPKKKASVNPLYEVHFGGPDLPALRLRNLLEKRIAAVPPGGSIDWVTYYFRDRRLAEQLLMAHRQGVKVTVTLEQYPRTAHANEAVIAILSGPGGLNERFRTLSYRKLPTPPAIMWKPHLHEKLYCFSHPKPIAFIGSFNPSGDEPEDDPVVLNEIGDQNRGHNLLIGIGDPLLVKSLVQHAQWINRVKNLMFYRFSPAANRVIHGKDTDIYFWPRISSHPVADFLLHLGPGTRIRMAASHIKGAPVVKVIKRIALTGAKVEILAEPTLRRVPLSAERSLIQAGIFFRRIFHPEGLPMHNKFILVEKGKRRWVIFGSFNWTMRSYWLNHEIGAISTNPQLFIEFDQRWKDLSETTNTVYLSPFG